MPDKQRIQADSPGEHPYDHLLPVIRAEKSWGNRADSTGWCHDPKLGSWSLTMTRPLHVSRLRETFEFPGTVSLGEARMLAANGIVVRTSGLYDSRHDISIAYNDWRKDCPASVVRLHDRLRNLLARPGAASGLDGDGVFSVYRLAHMMVYCTLAAGEQPPRPAARDVYAQVEVTAYTDEREADASRPPGGSTFRIQVAELMRTIPTDGHLVIDPHAPLPVYISAVYKDLVSQAGQSKHERPLI